MPTFTTMGSNVIASTKALLAEKRLPSIRHLAAFATPMTNIGSKNTVTAMSGTLFVIICSVTDSWGDNVMLSNDTC